MIPSMPDSTWADGGIAITKSKMSKRVLSKLAFGNYPMLSQNDVCMTKRGCDDACANLIRSGGDDEDIDDDDGDDGDGDDNDDDNEDKDVDDDNYDCDDDDDDNGEDDDTDDDDGGCVDTDNDGDDDVNNEDDDYGGD